LFGPKLPPQNAVVLLLFEVFARKWRIPSGVRQSVVSSTAFYKIREILRDLYSTGREGSAIALAIVTVIAATAIHNNILADRARSTSPSIPTYANTKSSLNAESPITGQLEATAFEPSIDANTKYNAIDPTNNQSSEAKFINAKSPSNGQREPKASTPSAHENTKYPSRDANSRKPKSPIKRQLEANTFEPDKSAGYKAINSINDHTRNANSGWQYCLAASGGDRKLYISSPFSRTVDLKIIEILFSQRLLGLQHEAVQCPIARYKGTLATMRDDAISFNRKIGKAIVTLNWEPYAQSEDEDPIDATIYTGQSEMTQDHPTAWQYCLAPSNVENKVYVSAPFLKSESLYATETAFAKALHESELPHDVIQCPNGTDEPTILSMRQHAISFNKDRGNTIVTLDWTLQNRSGG
jgi:hypothetical protein